MARNVPVSDDTKRLLDDLKPRGVSYDRLVRWILDAQDFGGWKEYVRQEAWRQVALAEVRRGRRLGLASVSLPPQRQLDLAKAARAQWKSWSGNVAVRRPSERHFQIQTDPARRTVAADALREVRPALVAGRPLQAQLFLAAAITELATTIGRHAVLSGDVAVTFYTASAVIPPGATIASPGGLVMATYGMAEAQEIGAVLERYGFVRTTGSAPLGRNETVPAWRLPDVPILVTFTGQAYMGDWSRHMIVDVDGHRLRIRGPEDTLWENFEWGAMSHDQQSWARALAVASAQADALDQTYLEMLARVRQRETGLRQLLAGKALS